MKIESGAFGQSQTAVYNSNTDQPVTREPQPTQQPSGGQSGTTPAPVTPGVTAEG